MATIYRRNFTIIPMITLLEAKKQTKQLQEKLKEMNIPVQKVILYGSVATQKNTEDSDVDIAILCIPIIGMNLRESSELFIPQQAAGNKAIPSPFTFFLTSRFLSAVDPANAGRRRIQKKST